MAKTSALRSGERRSHRRAPYAGLVVVRSPSGCDLLGRAVDVGEGGLRLRPVRGVARALPAGVTITLRLGDAERGWLRLSARFLRREGREWALGFEQQPLEAQKQLRRLIELLLAADVAARGAHVPAAAAVRMYSPEIIDSTPARAELEDQPNTSRVLPEVMADLAGKDPTLRLSKAEVAALRAACRGREREAEPPAGEGA